MIFNDETVKCIFNKLHSRIMMSIKDLKPSEVILNPVTVSSSMSLLKTRDVLLQNKIKRVVVLDKRKPVAVITEKDIARKIYDLGARSPKSVKAINFKPKLLYTLTRNHSIQNCAKLMKRHGINSVVIVNKNETLGGIVTKTSLISSYLTKEVAHAKVSKLMTRKLITVAPSDPILYVESLLLKYRISRVIVKRKDAQWELLLFVISCLPKYRDGLQNLLIPRMSRNTNSKKD